MKANVSVVIPCYNQGAYLTECLRSVFNSTVKDVETIIVDDGSDDVRTKQVLREVQASGVAVHRQHNRGLPAARNVGIGIATSPFVLPLDADDLLHPEFIEKTLAKIIDSPKVGFVTTWVQRFGQDNLVWKPPRPVLCRMLEENVAVSGCLVRRAAWQAVGGYDERMTSGYEDWDFWLRLLESKWRGTQVAEPLYFYRVKESSMFAVKRSAHEHHVEEIYERHYRYRRRPRQIIARWVVRAKRNVASIRGPKETEVQ